MKTNKAKAADRRGFLKLAGASVVGGGVAAVSATSAAADEAAKPAPGGDYHATEHVKRFYDLARDF